MLTRFHSAGLWLVLATVALTSLGHASSVIEL